jgi:putative hemolysin
VEPKKFIDVEKILGEKLPSIKKWLPGFLLNWIKRKLHEEDINRTMVSLEGLQGLAFNKKGLEILGLTVKTTNAHHVPKTGGCIVAANHPLGGLDGMALIDSVGSLRPDVKFFVNDVLKNIKNYEGVFVGVNKIGSSSTTSLRVMENIFKSEEAILFFPAGLVSRKQNGLIRDLEWKKSFVTQAIDHDQKIVPVFIEGENSKFFYRFANFRKFIGIKANIEMLFLPDEMFKQKGQTVTIHFGKPFDPSLLNNGRSHREWAAIIKGFIYSDEFKKDMAFDEYIKLKGLQ